MWSWTTCAVPLRRPISRVPQVQLPRLESSLHHAGGFEDLHLPLPPAHIQVRTISLFPLRPHRLPCPNPRAAHAGVYAPMHTDTEELGPCGWKGHQAGSLLAENRGGDCYHCSGRHLHRDRFHRRSLPSHLAMERKAQYAGEDRSQSVDGLGHHYRRCVHCSNVLLMGDPLRR